MRLKIELSCILFPLMNLEMSLQLNLSPSVGNSLDWTWTRTQRPLSQRSRAPLWREEKLPEGQPSLQRWGLYGRVTKRKLPKELLQTTTPWTSLIGPASGPDWNPIEHLWRDLETNLTELERCCKELPKDTSAKLVAFHSKRLEAVTAAKGASAERKAASTREHVISLFF